MATENMSPAPAPDAVEPAVAARLAASGSLRPTDYTAPLPRSGSNATEPEDPQILALRKDPAFLDGNDPGHAEVMAKLHARLALTESPQEKEDAHTAPIHEARSRFGVEVKNLPSVLAKDWDEGAERNFLTWGRENAVTPKAMQAAYRVYLKHAIPNMGDLPDSVQDEMRYELRSHFTRPQLDLLARWWKANVRGGER